MANLATVLKLEITRIARRELRAETESLKKAAAHYRSEIAALKRKVAELERQVAKVEKSMAKATPDGAKLNGNGSGEIKIRYSARSMAAQRKRLGLSAENMGKLFGVSGHTIYGWETGGLRPRNGQMPAIPPGASQVFEVTIVKTYPRARVRRLSHTQSAAVGKLSASAVAIENR